MRSFFIDRSEEPYSTINRDLIQGVHHELNLTEVGMINYISSHQNGYRLGTKQMAGDTGFSKRKVRRILRSLEEKGYLYRNEENWDKETGPEIIVAESPELLRQVLKAENLFPPDQDGDNSGDESTDEEPEDKEPVSTSPADTGPKVPDDLLRASAVFRPRWQRVPAKEQKPARFVRAPVRQPVDPSDLLPNLWQLSVRREEMHQDSGIKVARPHAPTYIQPTLRDMEVGHMRRAGRTHAPGRSDTCADLITINSKELTVRINCTASLLQSRRHSNVREQRARALAEVNSNSNASYRQTPPDRDRSHGRLFVKMFGEKSGRPYHGIRLYSKMKNDWHFRPTLHEHEEGSLSIYWLRADREPGVPIPTPRSETPDITERPLEEGAEPKASHEVPARFEEVGVLCGPDQTHPTGERPTGRSVRSGAGFEALLGNAQFSMQRGPHPWPEDLTGEELELSFAGHRPEEQLPEVTRASEVVYSTEFLEAAMHAIFEEPFEEEPRPKAPSPEDRRRAEEFGIPPRNVMVLRQIAEVTIDPHGPSFDYENTYESPGRDPWAIRMYSTLAFPDAGLPVSAKDYLDKKVAQACPTSPAEWASVLLMGLEEGWDPKYVKNFARCYRHEMRIELDPGREIKSRWTSKTRITRGSGIDLSGGDPEELLPADNRGESV